MTRITRDRGALKRDDRLDAVAGAVARWAESMNRVIEKAHLAHKEALVDAELELFMPSGRRRGSLLWKLRRPLRQLDHVGQAALKFQGHSAHRFRFSR